jgi:hypothetical protein
MQILSYNSKYVVYDDDGYVVIICSNKSICIAYANLMKRTKT